MRRYEVAIWIVWPSLCPEYVEEVGASSGLAAIALVMGFYGVQAARRVAVRVKDGPIEQYWSARMTDEGLIVGRRGEMEK
jgi:hypothetical protein